jgi:hypothetical protein
MERRSSSQTSHDSDFGNRYFLDDSILQSSKSSCAKSVDEPPGIVTEYLASQNADSNGKLASQIQDLDMDVPNGDSYIENEFPRVPSHQNHFEFGQPAKIPLLDKTSQNVFSAIVLDHLKALFDHTDSSKNLLYLVKSRLSDQFWKTHDRDTPSRCMKSALRPLIEARTLTELKFHRGKKGKYYRWNAASEKERLLEIELSQVKAERDCYRHELAKLTAMKQRNPSL